MAIRSVDLGPIENFVQFEDTDQYTDGNTHGLRVNVTPTADTHVLRKQDLTDVTINPLVDDTFVVISASGDLDNERVLTEGTNIDIVDSGAGNAVTINTVTDPTFGNINATGEYQVDGTKVVGNQGSAIVSLTGSSGGTANGAMETIADPADTPADADTLRDDLVANVLPSIRNNIDENSAKLEAILSALRTHGLIAT